MYILTINKQRIDNSKEYPTQRGAKIAISKMKDKARSKTIKIVEEITPEEFQDSFDAKYIDQSQDGLIIVKSKTTQVKKLVYTSVDDIRDELFDTIGDIDEK